MVEFNITISEWPLAIAEKKHGAAGTITYYE
jgi:hypothetical protein